MSGKFTSSFARAGLAGLLLLLVLVPAVAFADAGRWRLEGWTNTDFSKTSIKFDEILSGGPPKDGIPSIDKPKFMPVAENSDVGEMEPVIGLEIGGDARAYPLRILIWHEIVNDLVGDTPVAVTYCPLCNSAVVFDRRLEGTTYEFGTTGKLRNSDLVMYDRITDSWWQQFTGTAIVGSMTGKKLRAIPARLESLAEFKKRFPGGRILVPNDPDKRSYGLNPYVGYDSASKPFLYDGEMPEGIEPMSRVVALKVNGKPHAVPLRILRKNGEHRIGNVTLTWKEGQNSALDAPFIKEGRDVGNIIARRTENGKSEDVVYDVTFAFVFHAFFPQAPFAKP